MSVKERIDVTLSISEYKKYGKLKTLVLTGCIIHRYKEEIFTEFPEVDIFLSSEILFSTACLSCAVITFLLVVLGTAFVGWMDGSVKTR